MLAQNFLCTVQFEFCTKERRAGLCPAVDVLRLYNNDISPCLVSVGVGDLRVDGGGGGAGGGGLHVLVAQDLRRELRLRLRQRRARRPVDAVHLRVHTDMLHKPLFWVKTDKKGLSASIT